jgi:integrase
MVTPHIGHVRMCNVKPSTLRAWQRTVLETHSASTVRSCRGPLSAAFKDAVLDRVIASSPFAGVKAPGWHRERITPLTVAQVDVGEAAMPDRYRAIIPLAAGTGLRPSELFGLTVDRVDFLRRELRVDRQLVGRAGSMPVFGPPKTKAGVRVVPLPADALAALAAHLAQYPAKPGDLIFRTPRGGPVLKSMFYRRPSETHAAGPWEAARLAMGLSAGEGLHQLRHFYASLLIAAGRSVKEVQERLGHASAQETLDTYGHLWHDSDEGTRGAVDGAFRQARSEDVSGERADG